MRSEKILLKKMARLEVDPLLASDGTSRRVGRVQVAVLRGILERVAELTSIKYWNPGNSRSFAAARPESTPSLQHRYPFSRYRCLHGRPSNGVNHNGHHQLQYIRYSLLLIVGFHRHREVHRACDEAHMVRLLMESIGFLTTGDIR